MLNRLRTDFQLALISLFGACAVFGILPLAVYRFLSGQLMVGIVDTAMVSLIAAGVVYAWRTGETRRPGLVVVVATTVGAVTVSILLGVEGLFWVYAMILANFFLVGRRLAVSLTAVALFGLVVQGAAFDGLAQSISFLLSASVVSLFAFTFAARTETQRMRLESLATRDPLTGTDNRRAMEVELLLAVEAAARSGAAYAVVMLDLDLFKRINDQHGHDAGDRVLVAFVDLVQRNTRKLDRLFRYGGDEFVLLLPGADPQALHRVTEQLRLRIATELVGPGGPVTCSLGAAALLPGENWHAWLARADAALYRAKLDGRNRVEIDPAGTTPGTFTAGGAAPIDCPGRIEDSRQ